MSRSSLTTTLPAIPIWVSVFAFATVHESTQLILSLILSLLSIHLLRIQSKAPPRFFAYALITCCTITLFTIIPLPISLYYTFMGTKSELVLFSLTEGEANWQPLAFRPRTHTIWLAFSFSILLYGWACASIFTHIRRFKVIAKQIFAGVGSILLSQDIFLDEPHLPRSTPPMPI